MNIQDDLPATEVLPLSWKHTPAWVSFWAQFLWHWLRLHMLPWPDILEQLPQAVGTTPPAAEELLRIPRLPAGSNRTKIAAALTVLNIRLKRGQSVTVFWIQSTRSSTALPRDFRVLTPGSDPAPDPQLAPAEKAIRRKLPVPPHLTTQASLIDRPPGLRLALLVAILAAEIIWLIFSPLPFFYLDFSAHPHPRWMMDIGHAVARYDFLLNLLVFSIVSAVANLCVLGASRSAIRFRARSVGGLIMVFLLLELAQLAVPQRNFDLMDVLAASIGAVLATVPWTKARWLERAPPDNTPGTTVI